MCLSKKCCNRNELFPFIPLHFDNFSIRITGNAVVIDIKNLNFKNLTEILLVLTMFYSKRRLSGETHGNKNNSYLCQLGSYIAIMSCTIHHD